MDAGPVVAAVVAVAGTLAGGGLGAWLATRRDDRQWLREKRLELYEQIVDKTGELGAGLDDLKGAVDEGNSVEAEQYADQVAAALEEVRGLYRRVQLICGESMWNAVTSVIDWYDDLLYEGPGERLDFLVRSSEYMSEKAGLLLVGVLDAATEEVGFVKTREHRKRALESRARAAQGYSD
ncbi:MAG: hypothetical protein QOH79_132 [Acidimicrobiaceae bacterium]